MTVGTPTAITRLPRLSELSVFLLLPTPEPGLIPVSVSWMVHPSLLLLLAARASIATTISTSISSHIPLTISTVSIPVCAMTPGHMALMTRSGFPGVSRCLVTYRLSMTSGPMESGVTCLLPSPTTSIFPACPMSSLSLPSSSALRGSCMDSSYSLSLEHSIVIYCPFAFPRFFSPISSSTVMVVVLMLLSSFTTVFTLTPGIFLLSATFSLSSIARSVRISLFICVLLT